MPIDGELKSTISRLTSEIEGEKPDDVTKLDETTIAWCSEMDV